MFGARGRSGLPTPELQRVSDGRQHTRCEREPPYYKRKSKLCCVGVGAPDERQQGGSELRQGDPYRDEDTTDRFRVVVPMADVDHRWQQELVRHYALTQQ